MNLGHKLQCSEPRIVRLASGGGRNMLSVTLRAKQNHSFSCYGAG